MNGNAEEKPKFDPGKPYEPANQAEAKVIPLQEEPKKKAKPAFDPSKPFEEAVPPKKKESTSTSGSGLEKGSQQPSKPSEQSSTKEPVSLTQAQRDAVGKIKPVRVQNPDQARIEAEQAKGLAAKPDTTDGALTSIAKGVAGTIKDIIPKSFLTARAAGTRTTPYKEEDLNDLKAINDAANFLFRKNISEGKIMKALSVGDEEAREYIKEQIKKPEEFQKSQIKQKVELLKQADKERAEFEDYTKNTVKTLSQIKSPGDVASYIAYNVGQSIPQVGLSLMTGGMGSYIQEYSEIYDQQVQKIAEDKGITPQQVIEQKLDDPATGEAASLLAAALDRIGVEAIFKNFGKDALKSIIKSASKNEAAKQIGKSALKTAFTEGVTEGGQYITEEVGSSLAAGRDVSEAVGDVSGEELIESVAAGATSGLFLGGAGETQSQLMSKPAYQVADEVSEKLDPMNEQQVETAAEVVQEKVDEVVDNKDLSPQEIVDELRKEPETKQEDASIIREDQGAIPEVGQVQQVSQETGGNDIQQQAETGQVNAQAEPQSQEQVVIPDTSTEEEKQTALGARIEASAEPEAIKEQTITRDKYIPRKIIDTNEEAKKVLDGWNDDEFAERAIRDTSNQMPGGTRGALAANLYEKYRDAADASVDPDIKKNLYDKAADIAVWASQNLTKAGQETAIAGKIWKSIMSDEDLMVTAMEKQTAQQAKKLIAPIQADVDLAKQQFDQEIQRIIAQKVTEGVEERLKRAKLITKEKKQEISDAFDKLKVKNVGGAANDITRVLGATVWNGSVEAVKRAVLTGADLANAVQAGIDYVKQNYKGTDFDEAEYRSTLTPAVTQMIVPVPITPEQIDPAAVKTKSIKGKRKKDFMNQLVESYNSGKLTDAKFEELYAEKLGHKPYSPEERTKIRELAKVIAEAEKFKDAVKDKFTVANIKKYEALLKNAQKANKDLQVYNNRNPSSIWDTLSTMMQGNLLSSISLLTNIYANVAYQPLRFATALSGAIVDRSLTELAKTGLLGQNFSDIVGKDPSIDLVALQKGYFKGGWNGLMEGLVQLKTGQLAEDRNLREIQSSFSPVNAISRWADKDRNLSQKINDAVEGTLGWPPEVVFRLLNLGDKPFRRSAELARAYEIAATKKLEGPELLKFIMFPDADSQQLIEEAGKEATFQNESTLAKVAEAIVSTIINGGRIKGAEIPGLVSIPIIGGPLKVLAKTQMPFVRTPANILAKTFNYAIPPLTFIRGVYNISKGNKRTGSMLIGDALVGMMLYTVAKMLVESGLMTWDPDKRDDKAKQAMYTNEPPNSINVTAINRGLLGDGWESKDDDVWVSYQKLGLTGIVFQNYANQYYHAVKEGKQPFDDIIGDIGFSGIKTTSSALEQSFLTGTNTLLEALKDPEGYAGEKWIIGTTEALTATVIPRTLTGVSVASDEYIRDTRDDKLMTAMANTFKAKMFMGDQLPARVNVWGEKVTGNPEGRNRMVYYLFDVTKFKEVDQESYKYKIYKAWKDSGFNNDYLPGSPKREVTVKDIRIKLNAEQYEKLATFVGEQRARSVGRYASIHEKLDLEKLQAAYEKGLKDGKKKFLMDMGWSILSKTELEKMSESR